MMLDANTTASPPPSPPPQARSSEAASSPAPSGQCRDDTPAQDGTQDNAAAPTADQACNPQDDNTPTEAAAAKDAAPAVTDAVALLTVQDPATAETPAPAPETDKGSPNPAGAVIAVAVTPPPPQSTETSPPPPAATATPELAVAPVGAPAPVQPPSTPTPTPAPAPAPASSDIAPVGGQMADAKAALTDPTSPQGTSPQGTSPQATPPDVVSAQATPSDVVSTPATPPQVASAQSTPSAASVAPMSEGKASAGSALAEAVIKPDQANPASAEPRDPKAQVNAETKAAKKTAATDGPPKPESPVTDAADKSASTATADADTAEAKSAEPKKPDTGVHGKPVPSRGEGSSSETSASAGADAAAKSNGPPAQSAPQQWANPAGNDRVIAAAGAEPGIKQAASDVDAAAIPVAGLAVEIAARVQNGRNRFEIRLDPPELGRIEVRLDVDRGGQVTSRLIVDRPETLDLLRRDAAGLERALQDAGLKTGDNAMQFSLRDQGLARQDDQRPAPTMANVFVPESDATIESSSYGRMPRSGGGLDIRV